MWWLYVCDDYVCDDYMYVVTMYVVTMYGGDYVCGGYVCDALDWPTCYLPDPCIVLLSMNMLRYVVCAEKNKWQSKNRLYISQNSF